MSSSATFDPNSTQIAPRLNEDASQDICIILPAINYRNARENRKRANPAKLPIDYRSPPLVEYHIEHVFTEGGFVRIRIFRIGGIFRISIRPARAFRHSRESRQGECSQALAGQRRDGRILKNPLISQILILTVRYKPLRGESQWQSKRRSTWSSRGICASMD